MALGRDRDRLGMVFEQLDHFRIGEMGAVPVHTRSQEEPARIADDDPLECLQGRDDRPTRPGIHDEAVADLTHQFTEFRGAEKDVVPPEMVKRAELFGVHHHRDLGEQGRQHRCRAAPVGVRYLRAERPYGQHARRPQPERIDEQDRDERTAD